MGNQSSGKSSVIQGLIGREFLPRGSDIVTRCPLNIRVHQTHEEEEYVIFPGVRKIFVTVLVGSVADLYHIDTDQDPGSEKKFITDPDPNPDRTLIRIQIRIQTKKDLIPGKS